MYDSPENYILYKQLSLVMIYSEAEKKYYITVVIYEILLNRLNRSKDIYVNPLLEQPLCTASVSLLPAFCNGPSLSEGAAASGPPISPMRSFMGK